MITPANGSGRLAPSATLFACLSVLMAGGCSPLFSSKPQAEDAAQSKLTQLAEANGDFGGELALLENDAATQPQNASVQIRYAKALANAGRNAQAIQVAKPVYERDKGPSSLGLLIGRLYIRLEQAEAAIGVYQQVLAQTPDNIEALNGLGIAQVMSRTLAAAETDFRRAVTIAPTDAFSRNNLALVLAMERKTDEAIPLLQALLKEDDQSRRTRSNLALAYAVAGDRAGALATLKPIMNAADAELAIDSYARILQDGQDVAVGHNTDIAVATAQTRPEPHSPAGVAPQTQIPVAPVKAERPAIATASPPAIIGSAPPDTDPAGRRVVVHAVADAWVQLKDRGGAVVFNRTMRAGDSWQVPSGADLLLTTGNAGGVEILLNGAKTTSLGADKMFRRDVPLLPGLLKPVRTDDATEAAVSAAKLASGDSAVAGQ